MMNLQTNIDKIFHNIEVARIQVSEHHIVKIVAVSKYVDSKMIQALYEQGQRAFGENKVQDLTSKTVELIDLPLEWHFIGRLQKNKINQLIELSPSLFQSLDSLELASELNKRLEREGKTMSCLLQINSSNEESKAGIEPSEAIDAYQQITDSYPNIKLQGVMCIGAMSDDEQEVKASFLQTAQIFEQLKPSGANICSMGMSGDYELAIACGSNLIRMGSAFFD